VIAALRLQRRPGREADGATLLEGPHLVGAAIAAGVRPRWVFVLAGDATGAELATDSGTAPLVVDERTLRKLATTETPQSPIAVVGIPAAAGLPEGRVLVAWGVGDPGNCGTLIRTAAAFGYGYVSGPGAADSWSPKVLRAAAGAHFGMKIAEIEGVAELRRGGRIVVATVARGGDPPTRLPAAAAVLVGSEAHGLPDDVVANADCRVTIPTTGAVESLNAAVAGAIVAYVGAMGTGTNLSGS
jgi:TrmH family RNA methyltransferase